MTDGDRIKALIAGRNQAAFARDNAIPGGASMVSQHISGNRPVSVEAAIAYAKGFGVPLECVSPSAAELVRTAIASAATPAVAPQPPNLAEALPVVLKAVEDCPARDELRQLLPLLVTGAPAYRQRLAELLEGGSRPLGAPIATQHEQTLQDLSDQAVARHAAAQRRRSAGS